MPNTLNGMTMEELAKVFIKTDAEIRAKLRAEGKTEEQIAQFMQSAWDGFGAHMYNGRMV